MAADGEGRVSTSAAEVAGIWLGIVYGRLDKPPVRQRDVLVMLAVGCEWGEGGADRRVASIAVLASMTAAGERTVQRALQWARRADLLAVDRRGHQISPGKSVATTWRLVVK